MGRGVGIDHRNGAHYLKLAADQGYVAVQYNYRLQLFLGSGIPVTDRSAGHYFKLAAISGDRLGQFEYGMALGFRWTPAAVHVILTWRSIRPISFVNSIMKWNF
jgi:TPR repeat protein